MKRRVRGSAALEFMLVLPTMMLVVVAMLVLGNYLTTRYLLGTTTDKAVRVCSLSTVPNPTGCAVAAFNGFLPGFVQSRCGAPAVNARVDTLPGTSVRVLTVNATCNYDPALGAGLLAGAGLALGQLTSSSAMPLQQ